MIKKLLTIVAIASFATVNAQSGKLVKPKGTATGLIPNSNVQFVPKVNVAVCNDTLTGANNNDTLFTYSINSGTVHGYVGGNNTYGDKEKAEAYSSTGLVGTAQITGGIVLFYKHATANIGTHGTSNVVFKLYPGNNTTGPTGAAVNTFTASLTSILASSTATNHVTYCGTSTLNFSSNIIRPYSFNFPTATPVTGDFLLAVQLPTTSGDTAAIFVTSDNGHSASTAWEMQTPSTWVPFDDGTNASWQLDASIAILPKISCITGISKNGSSLEKNISIMPNPTNGLTNISFAFPTTQDLTVNVTNSLGQVVSVNKYTSVVAETVSLDLTNQSNGIYFVTISNGQEKMVQRVILNK